MLAPAIAMPVILTMKIGKNMIIVKTKKTTENLKIDKSYVFL